jgi:hypothetical protein
VESKTKEKRRRWDVVLCFIHESLWIGVLFEDVFLFCCSRVAFCLLLGGALWCHEHILGADLLERGMDGAYAPLYDFMKWVLVMKNILYYLLHPSRFGTLGLIAGQDVCSRQILHSHRLSSQFFLHIPFPSRYSQLFFP